MRVAKRTALLLAVAALVGTSLAVTGLPVGKRPSSQRRILHTSSASRSSNEHGSAAVAASRSSPPPRLPPALLLSSKERVGQAAKLPAGATDLGPVPPGQIVKVEVSLRPRDPAALAGFIQQVSTPGSPDYRRYLPRGQFGPRFGADQATIDDTIAALRAEGLRPGPADPSGLLVPAAGTAARVQDAFATELDNYRLPNGVTGYANTQAPEVPSVIAPQVNGVVGLQDLVEPHPLMQGSNAQAPGVSPQPATGPGSCSPPSGGLTATQLASAYGFDGLYGAGDSGAGTTVALFELADVNISDVNADYSCYYGPGATANVTTVEVDGGGGSSYSTGVLEADADTEVVTALAPAASTLVYEAPNNGTGPTDEWSSIVDTDRAKVVSTSWGQCELDADQSTLMTEDDFFQMAAAQGQSILAASGDYGAQGCTGDGTSHANALAMIDPASQPYVTGVGGTDLTVGPPQSETSWSSSGGGISDTWFMPEWQHGQLVPEALSSAAGCSLNNPANPYPTNGSYCREVPDVSSNAGTAEAVYDSSYPSNAGWLSVTGTSISAPLWGALLTLVNQTCEGNPVGFANPVLYTIGDGAGSGLNDVTTGGNGAYEAGPGYDMVTGLGSPDGSVLAPELCPQPLVTGVSPPDGSLSGGGTATISGTGFSTLPNATTIDFGSSPATNLVCTSSTECTATVPPASSAGQVAVSAKVGAVGSSQDGTYTYIAASDYHPIDPTRICDTRIGFGIPANQCNKDGSSPGTLGPGGTMNVDVAQSINIAPSQISAVVLNVTATNATSTSYLTVYPAMAARPLASNLNFVANQTIPNLVEVALGLNGSVTVFNDLGNVDVVIDVEGYVGTSQTQGDAFVPIAPTRIADTRAGSGKQGAGQALGPGGTLTISLNDSGKSGVPSTGVQGVVLNVTVTDTTADSFLTAYPAGTQMPLASNLNWVPGQTLANRVMMEVPISGSSNGEVTFYNQAGNANLVVDVNGYFTSSSGSEGFNGITPTRILDTRPGSGSLDHGSTIQAGAPLDVHVAGVGGVPETAKAVVANVTVTNTSAASYLTVYPAGASTPPLSSDLNWPAGDTVPNLVVTQLGTNGDIEIYNAVGTVDVVVDVVGWYY